MKKYLAAVPNAITLLRFVLTGVFIGLLSDRFSCPGDVLPFSVYVILGVICLSDLLDGAAARRLGAASAAGAVLDVSADFLFIFSAQILFVMARVIPLWYPFLVAADFLFFLLTSGYIKQHSDGGAVFVFDLLGKASAVIFYLVPAASCLGYGSPALRPGLLILLIVSALLAGASVGWRLERCIATGRKRKAALPALGTDNIRAAP